jgi:enoyl-CoA hydratase/carnithine racemase
MTYKSVKFDVREDGIATMTLNRPKALNCFNQDMFREWNEIIERCAYDRNIKVLVVTGEGRAFSSGVDLSVLGSDKNPAEFRYYYRQNHRGFDNLESLEKPVLAAINGICYGGGIELALSCDILFAADDAKFCLVENQLGCIPASGACNRMIYYVGVARTKEMIINGWPIDSEEAFRIGLVNHIVKAPDLLKEVYAYAERLLDNAPFAMGMGKHIVHLCMNTDMHTGRFLERLGQSVLVLSDDHKEGMSAFFEKRKPKFKGR